MTRHLATMSRCNWTVPQTVVLSVWRGIELRHTYFRHFVLALRGQCYQTITTPLGDTVPFHMNTPVPLSQLRNKLLHYFLFPWNEFYPPVLRGFPW